MAASTCKSYPEFPTTEVCECCGEEYQTTEHMMKDKDTGCVFALVDYASFRRIPYDWRVERALHVYTDGYSTLAHLFGLWVHVCHTGIAAYKASSNLSHENYLHLFHHQRLDLLTALNS